MWWWILLNLLGQKKYGFPDTVGIHMKNQLEQNEFSFRFGGITNFEFDNGLEDKKNIKSNVRYFNNKNNFSDYRVIDEYHTIDVLNDKGSSPKELNAMISKVWSKF